MSNLQYSIYETNFIQIAIELAVMRLNYVNRLGFTLIQI